MSKRFTDTEKWKIAWFRKLSPKMKCAWSFIVDNCDHAGVWHEDIIMMSNYIGEEIDHLELEKAFKGKIQKFDEDKYFIKDFIDFQYGELNPGNRVHKSVIRKLEKEGLYEQFGTVLKPLMNSSEGAKDKDKDKAKDKAMDKEKDKEKESDKITDSKLIDLFNKHVAGKGRAKHFPGFNLPRKALENLIETSGFPQFQKVEQWKKILEDNVATSNFLIGNNEINFTVSLPWLVDQDNLFKVVSGQYAGVSDEGFNVDTFLDNLILPELGETA